MQDRLLLSRRRLLQRPIGLDRRMSALAPTASVESVIRRAAMCQPRRFADKFERCRRHHVNALKHILHVLRPNKILYGFNFRGCHLPNNVYSVAVRNGRQRPTFGGGSALNSLSHSSKFLRG